MGGGAWFLMDWRPGEGAARPGESDGYRELRSQADIVDRRALGLRQASRDSEATVPPSLALGSVCV